MLPTQATAGLNGPPVLLELKNPHLFEMWGTRPVTTGFALSRFSLTIQFHLKGLLELKNPHLFEMWGTRQFLVVRTAWKKAFLSVPTNRLFIQVDVDLLAF